MEYRIEKYLIWKMNFRNNFLFFSFSLFTLHLLALNLINYEKEHAHLLVCLPRRYRFCCFIFCTCNGWSIWEIANTQTTGKPQYHAGIRGLRNWRNPDGKILSWTWKPKQCKLSRHIQTCDRCIDRYRRWKIWFIKSWSQANKR